MRDTLEALTSQHSMVIADFLERRKTRSYEAQVIRLGHGEHLAGQVRSLKDPVVL